MLFVWVSVMNSSKLPVWVERGRTMRQEIPSQQWCNGSFEVQGRLDESHSLGMNSSECNNTGFLFHTMRSGESESKTGNDMAIVETWIYMTATSKIKITHSNVPTALMTSKWGSSKWVEYCIVDLFHLKIHSALEVIYVVWCCEWFTSVIFTDTRKNRPICFIMITNTQNYDFASR